MGMLMPQLRKCQSLSANAMKNIAILLAFLIYSCSNNKISNKINPIVDTSMVITAVPLKIECDFSEVLKSIVHVDTVINRESNKEDTIKSFDAKGHLIEFCTTNSFGSGSPKIYLAKYIYDTSGYLLYQSKNLNIIQAEWYCYKYDRKGKLISKQGQDSLGNQISEKYVY